MAREIPTCPKCFKTNSLIFVEFEKPEAFIPSPRFRCTPDAGGCGATYAIEDLPRLYRPVEEETSAKYATTSKKIKPPFVIETLAKSFVADGYIPTQFILNKVSGKRSRRWYLWSYIQCENRAVRKSELQ